MQFKRVKKDVIVDKKFVIASLVKKTKEIDWQQVQNEMIKFVQIEDIPSLKLWNEHFFTQIISKKITF